MVSQEKYQNTTYIVKFRLGIKFDPFIGELSIHVGRFPLTNSPTVHAGSDKDNPAVAADRGSGEDDG